MSFESEIIEYSDPNTGNCIEIKISVREILKYEDSTLIGSFLVKDLAKAGYVKLEDVLAVIENRSGCYSCGSRNDKKVSSNQLVLKLKELGR